MISFTFLKQQTSRCLKNIGEVATKEITTNEKYKSDDQRWED